MKNRAINFISWEGVHAECILILNLFWVDRSLLLCLAKVVDICLNLPVCRGWLPCMGKRDWNQCWCIKIQYTNVWSTWVALTVPRSQKRWEDHNWQEEWNCEFTFSKRSYWYKDIADFDTYSSWGLWGYLCDLGLETKCVSTQNTTPSWDSSTFSEEYPPDWAEDMT